LKYQIVSDETNRNNYREITNGKLIWFSGRKDS
jgi:hypothetical protein